MKKRLLSGITPSGTGNLHIGNYFGALKQWVDLQDSHESLIFVSDLHALTVIHDKEQLKSNIINVVLDYLGAGIDPEKVILFKQSDISAHPELCWIFNCITTMPYLERAHAYKDAHMKAKEINVGLFDYPLLMSADILLYDSEVVPVGADQKQHVEYARDTAQKFNNTFGETFKLPEPMILDGVAVVPGTDGRKMSKSYGNTIPLFGTDEEIKKAVMGIVTDSDGKFPQNVFAIHSLLPFYSKDEISKIYEEHPKEYKWLKEKLAEDLIKFITPMRERRDMYAKDLDKVKEILKKGGEKAREIAEKKMKIVRDNIGVNI
ncbi:MAG: tryptophan--tRNA ligase [Patescibacteria group bacterium]